MKRSLLFLFVLIVNLTSMYGQSQWRADLRVDYENNFGQGELNVDMHVYLYKNDELQPVLLSTKYEFFKRYILWPDPEWNEFETSPQWGDNHQGTHAYQDSTIIPEGKFEIKCKITLKDNTIINSDVITIPWYSVLPDQQKISGTSFGSIDYWYKGSFKDNNGLNEIYIPRYDPKVLQADINVVSNPPEKYNYWTGNFGQTYHINFVKFYPEELLSTPMLSQFGSARNATVRAKVDNYYLDVINFKDPWLRDFYQEPFGIRNQGLLAQPLHLANVNDNLSINSSHQGVLLYQGSPNWSPPYYTVNIPSSINLPENGGTHNLYIQTWDVSGASLQYPNSLTTGIVFTNTSGATVTANVKATGLSDDEYAYSSNNQRKFISTNDGYLHSVYESMGHVWYEISSNNGQTWTLQNSGQPLDNGGGENPSIDWVNIDDGVKIYVVIVFQQTETGIGYPYSVRASVFGGQVPANFNPYNKVLDTLIYSSGYQSTHNEAMPVVAMYPGDHSAGLAIVWHTNSGFLFQQAGLRLDDPIFTTTNDPVIVSGTNLNSINPSLATYKLNNLGHYYLVWEENNTICRT